MPIYLGTKEIDLVNKGSTELNRVMYGTKEIWSNWPLNTYYDYGTASGIDNYVVGKWGTILYEAIGLDATPISKTGSYGYTQYGNCYTHVYYGGDVISVLKNSANNVTASSGRGAEGEIVINSPDSALQYNYYFAFSNDEGSGKLGKTYVKYNDSYHTLQEAINDKKIKPLVPIAIGAQSISEGSLNDLMTGHSIHYTEVAGFTIIVQANEGVQAVKCECTSWETYVYAYWLCQDGRVCNSTNIYDKSQYGQKTW